MVDFPSPPRGSGRHSHRNDEPSRRYQRGVARPAADPDGYLPRLDEMDPVETSGTGLYRVPVPGDPEALGPAISQTRLNRPPAGSVPSRERADLVVPRVYLEPDEAMDRLRQRALRWGILRDVVLIVVGVFLIGRWIAMPMLQALGLIA